MSVPVPAPQQPSSRAVARLLAAGGVLVLLSALPAHAGQCPAGQATSNAAIRPMTEARGVTDTVLASIDLATEPVAIPGRQFRLRRLEIAPGGVVPFHPHADRPAIIHIVSGEIVEHSTDCRVPIIHRAGDTVPERATVSHWWENRGPVPVVLLSSDLLPTGADPAMM